MNLVNNRVFKDDMMNSTHVIKNLSCSLDFYMTRHLRGGEGMNREPDTKLCGVSSVDTQSYIAYV